MADEREFERDRADELRQINEARAKHNRGLKDIWWGHEKREAEQERENERVREGREHHDDEIRERRVLAKLAEALERLLEFLEGHGGGAKLQFKLTKKGDLPMAQISIVSIQRVGGQVGVMTSAPHGLKAGDSFAIDGASDPTLNSAQGAATVSPTGLDDTHFMFAQAGPDSPVITGGSLTAPGVGAGGGGTVGTDSVFGVTVQDQTGATQPLPAGVTPAASVTGGDGTATATLSADNSTVTVKYNAAGDYVVTVSDPSGKVASGTANETVTGGTTGTLKFVLTKK